MTDDRDPLLQQLFDVAGQHTYDDGFVEAVMSEINHRRRRAILVWVIVGLALIPVVGLLGTMLQDVFQVLARILPTTIVDSEAEWLAQALAPVNTIGALVAFGILGLRMVYRRIFA